jgi:ABC-2 type transport system permease protein
MSERWDAFVQLLTSQLKQLFREPEIMFWVFAFPIVLTVGLGIAFRDKPPDPVPVGVLEGPGAEPLMQRLSGVPGIKVETVNAKDGRGALRRGRLSLLAEAGEPVLLRLDPSRPDAPLAKLAVTDALQRASGRTDPVEIQVVEVSEPGGSYVDFLIPGLLGMNMMNGGLWGLGFALVDARIRKQLKRMAATPMRRPDYLLAILTGRLMLVLVEVTVLLSFGRLLFGVRVAGSLGALAAVASVGTFTFSCVGLLIGSRAKKIETAAGLVNLVSMPMLLVSGVFFSYERFPTVIHPLIRALPLTALNDSMRAVINEGASLASQAANLGILAAWAVLCFTTALWRFRWT